MPSEIDPVDAAIRAFNGGDCFFARRQAESPTRVQVEVFASDVEKMGAFDRVLSEDVEKEAVVGGRLISREQCPTVSFAARSSAAHADISIRLHYDRISSGKPLSGSLFLPEPLELMALYVVAPDGERHDVSKYLSGGTDGAYTFAAPIFATTSNAEQRALLVALASGDSSALGLAAAREHFGGSASLEEEAATPVAPPAVALAYFVVRPDD